MDFVPRPAFVLVLFACILFGSPNCYSEKVLPVPTGEWYSDSALSKGMDSCEGLLWSYPVKAASKNSLIGKAFGSLPVHNNCKWSKPFFLSFSGRPFDFPSSEIADYQELIFQGYPKSEKWGADCKTKEGIIEDNATHNLYPIYQCPKNSRIADDETPNPKSLICSTTPRLCEADVVGRDIDTLGLGWLGHIALATNTNLDSWTNGSFVVEVLNNKTVININTLSAFKNPSLGNYWGAVYGLPDLTYIDAQQAQNAILAGLAQRKFKPQYTVTAQWQRGDFQETLLLDSKTGNSIAQPAIQNAIFRCDTFVNFCYKEGFNVTIPSGPVILPKPTYDSFINKRESVSTLLFSTVNLEKELTTDLNKNAWLKLDAVIKKYMENPSLSHRDKILELWKIALQFKNNPNQFGYLVDSISIGQYSYFMIPKMILAYNQKTSIENKRKLLFGVTTSSQIAPSEFQKIIPERKSAILQAQNFIINLIKTEPEPVLLNDALMQAGSILPATLENYTLVKNGQDRLAKKLRKGNQEDFSLLNLSMVLANPEMQIKKLPILLNETRTNKENEDFNSSLFLLLKKMNPKKITASSKKLLEKYIIEQNNKYKYLEITFPLNQTKDINTLFAWASVHSEDEETKKKFIINYILKSDGITQAWLISQMNREIASAIKLEDVKLLLKTFRHQLNISNNLMSYRIYAKAITLLSFFESKK